MNDLKNTKHKFVQTQDIPCPNILMALATPCLHDMQKLALEKVFTPVPRILEKRENLWIKKLEAENCVLKRNK